MESRSWSRGGLAIAAWAVGGMLLILVDAIVRLLPRALEPIGGESFDAITAVAYLAAMVALAYSEGYRGFQQRFSPRVIARAMHLAEHPRPLLVALAPIYVMGLIHASPRRLVGSWLLCAGIVAMIVAVSQLPQPWRGAVDAGVVVGLGWGSVATLALLIRAVQGEVPDVDPDLPHPHPELVTRRS